MRRPHHRLSCLALIALGLSWSPAALAETSVAVRISNSWIKSPSFDAVSDNDHLTQVELTAGQRLLALGPGDLWIEGSYLVGPSEAALFGETMEAHALLQSVTLGARYCYGLTSWLVPFVRLGAGLGIGTLELKPGIQAPAGSSLSGPDSTPVEDRAVSFSGHLLAGLELLWPRAPLTRRRTITGGLVLEAGYVYASGLQFALAPERNDELMQIPTAGTRIGALSTSGWQLRVGGVLRF